MADSRSGYPHRAGPYFTVDLHLHTNRGSSDSNLAPKDLVNRARAIGIGAVCITEHDNMWDSREIAALAAGSGVIFIRGMEVTTDMGHVGTGSSRVGCPFLRECSSAYSAGIDHPSPHWKTLNRCAGCCPSRCSMKRSTSTAQLGNMS